MSMKGHKGTFGHDENVLNLDFVGGHVTVCAYQNSTNFIPERLKTAAKSVK